jgi:hypothetical protein
VSRPALIQHCVEPVTACQHMRAITEHNNPTWIFCCYRPVEFVRNGQIVLALKYPIDPGIFPAGRHTSTVFLPFIE